MQHQITEQLIKQAAVNNGTSAITEAAVSQANARQNRSIRPGAPSSSTAYTGGALSSITGAASSVGNVIGSIGILYLVALVRRQRQLADSQYQKTRAALIIHYLVIIKQQTI